MKATAKDLRFYSKEILDSVDRGEEVVITYRGRPHAKLVPISSDASDTADDIHNLFGIWQDNKLVSDVEEYLSSLRRGRFDAG